MPDISTLLERCRRGDALAWEALVRGYQARVFGVACRYLRDREEARDVAQEIFVRVYKKLDSFHGGEAFLPWLLRLARNACIDRLRRRAARPPASDVPVDDTLQLSSNEPGPHERSETEQRKRLLYRALDRLSEKNREIILLKEIQGLKFEEISKMLELPVGTVKSRSNRARVELATCLRQLDASYGS